MLVPVGGSAPAADPQLRLRPEQPNVVLLGDSVTEQAFGYLGGPSRGAPAHLRRWSGTGWTVAYGRGRLDPGRRRHPEYVAPDGIHISSRAAAEARQAFYWNAVRA